MTDHKSIEHRALRRVPRRRGALTGLLVLILGAWGAVIPFVGPYFNYGYSPLETWHWTAARGWLEVLPGGVAVLGGLLLIGAASRLTVLAGAWLAAAAGAWFVVGPTLAEPLGLNIGVPVSDRETVRVLATLGLFLGLGAAILFVAAIAIGRLSVRSVGDLRAAERWLQREEEAAAEIAAADRATTVPERDVVPADVPVTRGTYEPTMPMTPVGTASAPTTDLRGPAWGSRTDAPVARTDAPLARTDAPVVAPAEDDSSTEQLASDDERAATHHRLLGRR